MAEHHLSFVNCHFDDVTFTKGLLHITDKMKPNRARENEQLSQNMPFAFQSILWKCHGHIHTVHFWCLIYCNQSMHYKSISLLESQGVSNQIWKICCVILCDQQWLAMIFSDLPRWDKWGHLWIQPIHSRDRSSWESKQMQETYFPIKSSFNWCLHPHSSSPSWWERW